MIAAALTVQPDGKRADAYLRPDLVAAAHGIVYQRDVAHDHGGNLPAPGVEQVMIAIADTHAIVVDVVAGEGDLVEGGRLEGAAMAQPAKRVDLAPIGC